MISIQCAYAYTNTQFGFAITPPSRWEISSGGLIFSNPSSGAFIMVNVEDSSLTLFDYASSKQSWGRFYWALNNYHLIDSGFRNIGGVSCYEIVYNYTQGSDSKITDVFFVENGRAFTITYGGSPLEHAYNLPLFEQSPQTFRINSISLSTYLVVAGVIIITVILAVIILFKRKHRSNLKQNKEVTTPLPFQIFSNFSLNQKDVFRFNQLIK